MERTSTSSAIAEPVSAMTKRSESVSAGRVRSADGTWIAFDRIGAGEPVILVDGALCFRRLGPGPALAKLLAPHFTVITYDRRGRGDSGDTLPYEVEREVEDIAALLAEVGGSAYLWGTSSGAMLALEAARQLAGVRKLALYEAPLIVDRGPATRVRWDQIADAVAAGKRSEAIRLFMRGVGMPGLLVALMRLSPIWRRLTSLAHTLPHDGALVSSYQEGRALPAARWRTVTAPVLVMAGGKSPVWMHRGNGALAAALPDALYCALEGQTHRVKPTVHAPVLVEFFGGEARTA